MTVDEAGTMFALSRTVHHLPLPSIRLGRSLRFDPKDVCRLIATSEEAFIA
jgi:hypothetical protein